MQVREHVTTTSGTPRYDIARESGTVYLGATENESLEPEHPALERVPAFMDQVPQIVTFACPQGPPGVPGGL